MIIYDKLRVIDGDTIEIRLWPSGLVETCRIEGLDTDELGTKRGDSQSLLGSKLMARNISPYIIANNSKYRLGTRRKRDAYGRLLVKVYVWRWWRYVNYAECMKSTGNVKRGSKWNK